MSENLEDLGATGDRRFDIASIRGDLRDRGFGDSRSFVLGLCQLGRTPRRVRGTPGGWIHHEEGFPSPLESCARNP